MSPPSSSALRRPGSPSPANGPSPLCVEEFDVQDRNFKPCPCGYQVRLTVPPSAAVATNQLPPCRSASSASTTSGPT
jgi:hypothetical protein